MSERDFGRYNCTARNNIGARYQEFILAQAGGFSGRAPTGRTTLSLGHPSRPCQINLTLSSLHPTPPNPNLVCLPTDYLFLSSPQNHFLASQSTKTWSISKGHASVQSHLPWDLPDQWTVNLWWNRPLTHQFQIRKCTCLKMDGTFFSFFMSNSAAWICMLISWQRKML